MAFIPFNRISTVGTESRYIKDAFDSGHIAGDGPCTVRCHRLLEHVLGIPKVLLTTSCTHALEMAALLLDVKPEDEVIIPSFAFVSTANAFLLRGAKPIFVDVRPDTLNLDEELLESQISPRTKVIVPVHYAGVGCEMDSIISTAAKHGVSVVEDNAHGLFGRFRGKYLGTFGAMATQSFHETKNFSCGEGGALLISDTRYIERAEIIREKGTNRSRFYRGQVDKYTWLDLGSSYLPSDILAAFLYAQLEVRDQIQAKRKQIWWHYWERLKDWANEHGVRLPVIPQHCDHPYHMFYIILPALEARQALIQHLKERDILAVFHYLPLHLSEMGRRLGGKPGDCPVTEDISDRLLRLPFYSEMSESDQEQVIESIKEFSVVRSALAAASGRI